MSKYNTRCCVYSPTLELSLLVLLLSQLLTVVLVCCVVEGGVGWLVCDVMTKGCLGCSSFDSVSTKDFTVRGLE